MHLIKVTDSETGRTFSYDADMAIKTVDDGLAFFTSQLSVVEAKLYETKYQNILFQEFVPVDSSDPEWVDEISYISYDAVTMGKFIGANAKDLPEVAANATKSTIPVFYGGIACSWSLDELRKSQAMRMPLDATLGKAKVRGYQEHKQQVAYLGDSARGVTGLFNNANVPETTTTVDWATATGIDKFKMLNEQLNNVYETTKQVHIPNMLLVPQNVWQYLGEPMHDGTDTTVLEYFLKNNMSQSLGVPVTVRPVFQLNDLGVNSTGRFMAYELNQENLVMKDPMPLRSIAPQPDGLTIKVPSEYKFGGVEFRYPLSALYTDLPA